MDCSAGHYVLELGVAQRSIFAVLPAHMPKDCVTKEEKTHHVNLWKVSDRV